MVQTTEREAPRLQSDWHVPVELPCVAAHVDKFYIQLGCLDQLQ